MDEQMTEQLEALPVSEPSIYEQLYRYLYDYHFGRITFLELLAACRRERSSGHTSCSESARILQNAGRNDSKGLTYRQNTVGHGVLCGLEGYHCPCPTPKIRYGSA